ncbi:SulP family inorganic anion transporter [Amycolatopsis sp. NPDC059027]|uniref:SulP family inorganic anion transporter n=1 Tax=unclassified Amycolatopsis TaxID=2618356 RepID=UPI00366EF228
MRWSAVVPGVVRLRGYRRGWMRADVVAGVTVAAYLVPQVMAYAQVAGVPAASGLWAAVVALGVYVVFGSSSQLSVGPESTTALMTAAVLAPLTVGDPRRYGLFAAVLAVLVGCLCLLAGLARLGVLAELLSKPVLVGYLAGIALIMIVGQLGRVTRVPPGNGEFVDQLRSFVARAGSVHVPTLVLSGTVLACLLCARRWVPRVPAPLPVLLLVTAVVGVFGLARYGIDVVGEVSRGLPPVGGKIGMGEVGELVLPAAGIAIVGFSDNVLTARAFADRRGEVIDAQQELRALGIANIAAGLVHGFPVSSSGSRTALGAAAGSRTQLHTLVALLAVLGVLVFAGPVLAAFPTAALGALVVYAALTLIDVREFRRIARFRHSEFALAVLTTAGVLALGVLYGVLAAVGLSILDLLRRIARPHAAVLGYARGVAGMHDIDDYPEVRTVAGLVVYRYDAPLCFANAEDFHRRALAAVTTAEGPVRWFVLNAEAIVDLDVTAADALDRLRTEMTARGVVFALARAKQELCHDLARFGMIEAIGTDRVFPTLPTAVAAYERWAGG